MQAALRAHDVRIPAWRRVEEQEKRLRASARAQQRAVRARRLYFLIFLAVALFLSALLFTTLCARVVMAQNGARLQQLDKELSEERLKQSSLHVEVAALLAPPRIERLAAEHLGMVFPRSLHSVATEEYRTARSNTETVEDGTLGQAPSADRTY
ncbi:MAG: FtsB/FtsL family cell division protein [Candidatus Geothermincolia bacterium]